MRRFDAFDGLRSTAALLVGLLTILALGGAVLVIGAILRRLR